MYTYCPDCSSVYEISAEQLGAASGLVRCGNCNATFSALRRLTETPPEFKADTNATSGVNADQTEQGVAAAGETNLVTDRTSGVDEAATNAADEPTSIEKSNDPASKIEAGDLPVPVEPLEDWDTEEGEQDLEMLLADEALLDQDAPVADHGNSAAQAADGTTEAQDSRVTDSETLPLGGAAAMAGDPEIHESDDASGDDDAEELDSETTAESERTDEIDLDAMEDPDGADATEATLDAEHAEDTDDADNTDATHDGEHAEDTGDTDDTDATHDGEHAEDSGHADATDATLDAEHAEDTDDTDDTDATHDAEHAEDSGDADATDATLDAEHTEDTGQADDTDATLDAEHAEDTGEADDTDATLDAERAEDTGQADDTDATLDAEHAEDTGDADDTDATHDAERAEDTGEADATDATLDAEHAKEPDDADDTDTTHDAEHAEDPGEADDTAATLDAGDGKEFGEADDTDATHDAERAEDTGEADDTDATLDAERAEDTGEADDTDVTLDAERAEDTGEADDTDATLDAGDGKESGGVDNADAIDDTDTPVDTVDDDVATEISDSEADPDGNTGAANILIAGVDGTFDSQLDEKRDYKDLSHYLTPGRSLARRIGESFILLLLVAVLGAQFVHHNRTILATHPQYGAYLQSTYKALGLALDIAQSADDYRVARHTIVPDADNLNTLMARATIVNNSAQPRPVPMVRLELRNRWGDAIFARVFSADEYLTGTVPATMTGNSRLEVALDIVNPTDDIDIGYSFDICVTGTDGTPNCDKSGVFE